MVGGTAFDGTSLIDEWSDCGHELRATVLHPVLKFSGSSKESHHLASDDLTKEAISRYVKM